MWKRLAILAIAAFVTVCVSGQPNKAADDKQQPENQVQSSAAATVNTERQGNGQTDQAKADTYSPKWYAKPDWWLVIVAGLTGCVIGWQSWETRKSADASKKAAEAALLQANHMVTSERAWMIAEAGDAGIPPEIEGATGIRRTEFSVRFVNNGKTPAFLLEAGYCGKVLPNGEQLPAIPPPYGEMETSKWDGKGLPLLPGADVRKNHLGTWANDPVKITRGFDVLWVYGYIKYGDAFGFVRETRYCYRWVHGIESWQVSGFIAGGPESYNHAT